MGPDDPTRSRRRRRTGSPAPRTATTRITYGCLVGEVVRRISGKSLGTFFHDEIAAPLDLEFWIGLPDEQEHARRAARRSGSRATARTTRTDLTALLGPDSCSARRCRSNGAFGDARATGSTIPRSTPRRSRPPTASPTPGRSRASTPGSSAASRTGPSDALLTPEQVDAAAHVPDRGPRPVLSFPGIEWPARSGSGSGPSSAFAPYGGERAFGHSGAGGSVGFADPEAGIAGGYVMNRMMQGLSGDPRSPRPHQGQLRRRRRPRRLRLSRVPSLRRSSARSRSASSSTTPASMASTSACRVRDRAAP